MTDERRDSARREADRLLARHLDAHILRFDELADVVLGSRASDLQGGGRLPDGVTHDIVAIKVSLAHLVKNGNGGRIRLSTAQRIGAGIVFAVVVWREVQTFL